MAAKIPQHPFGTRHAIQLRMPTPRFNVDSPALPAHRRPGMTLVSLVAAKAGREAVWVLIAAAFFVVEALVFLTELPTAKLFHRREANKAAAGHKR